jgi:hypothetical protein
MICVKNAKKKINAMIHQNNHVLNVKTMKVVNIYMDAIKSPQKIHSKITVLNVGNKI